MAIETIENPKTSFVYKWHCAYTPCSAYLRGTIGDAVARGLDSISFDCPHCARRTIVPLRPEQ